METQHRLSYTGAIAPMLKSYTITENNGRESGKQHQSDLAALAICLSILWGHTPRLRLDLFAKIYPATDNGKIFDAGWEIFSIITNPRILTSNPCGTFC